MVETIKADQNKVQLAIMQLIILGSSDNWCPEAYFKVIILDTCGELCIHLFRKAQSAQAKRRNLRNNLNARYNEKLCAERDGNGF
jgi:hypothetical protein